MKITINSTTQIVEVNGFRARVWDGTTESGIPVQCLIARVAAPNDGRDLTEFSRELNEHQPPSETPRAFPLRMFLD